MGIPITVAGTIINNAPQQELPQDRAAVVRQQQMQTRARAASVQKAAFAQFESSLPGNREPSEKNQAVLYATAADLEQISLAFNKKLKFVVDHESHEVIVKVIDAETDKVIKVLPPEEMQRLHRKIKETIGFLFDERV
jgi:flagellar protein FlaG